jgi:peptidyl-prolyl cis-trans isomerase B (cyclophilin B)
VPTNKQRREAAQRRLQRQLERREQQAKKRRRNLLVLVAAAAVLVVVGAAVLITTLVGGDDDPTADAAATTSAAPSDDAPATSAAAASTNPDGTVSCSYLPDDSGNPNLTDVGTPPSPEATPTQGTTALRMTTGQGDLTLTLDRAKAPCAAASFTYLAQQGFFDGSPCHREVNQEAFGVLQCGDPSGTGQGGPTYKFGQEVTAETTYPRGTIAMANSGSPNSTGSQFFLCFTDTMLSPDYTAVGTVDEAGLAVLDQIAAAGNDGSFEPSPGGGAPKTPVTIESMTVL